VVASGTVSEVIGQTHRNVMRGNGILIQVSSQSVAEAQQVLKAMPYVMQATMGEKAGWLRVELKDSADRTSTDEDLVNNRILEALIRAEIPIFRFESEGGRLQDVFLHLTEEAIV
jgi:hypothetical protein